MRHLIGEIAGYTMMAAILIAVVAAYYRALREQYKKAIATTTIEEKN